MDPFTPEQALWEFENIFVLSGQTGGSWSELSGEFARLKRAEPGEAAAREILDRARAFGDFCAGFWAEPIKFKEAHAAPAAEAATD